MAESMVIECMYRLCKEVVAVFEQKYLTTPNEEDTVKVKQYYYVIVVLDGS
jgi:hypothetical protein